MGNEGRYTLNIFADGYNHNKSDVKDIAMESLKNIKDTKNIYIESVQLVESGNMKMPNGSFIDGSKYKVTYINRALN